MPAFVNWPSFISTAPKKPLLKNVLNKNSFFFVTLRCACPIQAFNLDFHSFAIWRLKKQPVCVNYGICSLALICQWQTPTLSANNRPASTMGVTVPFNSFVTSVAYNLKYILQKLRTGKILPQFAGGPFSPGANSVHSSPPKLKQTNEWDEYADDGNFKPRWTNANFAIAWIPETIVFAIRTSSAFFLNFLQSKYKKKDWHPCIHSIC